MEIKEMKTENPHIFSHLGADKCKLIFVKVGDTSLPIITTDQIKPEVGDFVFHRGSIVKVKSIINNCGLSGDIINGSGSYLYFKRGQKIINFWDSITQEMLDKFPCLPDAFY